MGLFGLHRPGQELGISVLFIPAVAIAGATKEEGNTFERFCLLNLPGMTLPYYSLALSVIATIIGYSTINAQRPSRTGYRRQHFQSGIACTTSWYNGIGAVFGTEFAQILSVTTIVAHY